MPTTKAAVVGLRDDVRRVIATKIAHGQSMLFGEHAAIEAEDNNIYEP